jgi:hypothetical protein
VNTVPALENHEFVIYIKWTDFAVSWCLFYSQSLTLAYYRICTLRICNALKAVFFATYLWTQLARVLQYVISNRSSFKICSKT